MLAKREGRADELLARKTAEVSKLRGQVRDTEREISGFRRDLALLVHLAAVQLPVAVADLYRRYLDADPEARRGAGRQETDPEQLEATLQDHLTETLKVGWREPVSP